MVPSVQLLSVLLHNENLRGLYVTVSKQDDVYSNTLSR